MAGIYIVIGLFDATVVDILNVSSQSYGAFLFTESLSSEPAQEI